MPNIDLQKLVNATLWASGAVIVTSLLVSGFGPGPNPNLAGGFDSVTLAAELAPTAETLADVIAGQETAFRRSVLLDFPLIISYAVLFWLCGRMEMRRSRRFVFPGFVAASGAWIAGAADVAENLAMLYPDRFPFLLHSAALVKWGVLGVVLLSVSFLFFRWLPLATEFHVALAATAFFYFAAGLIAVYGVLFSESTLAQVVAPMALGIVLQAAMIWFRREKFLAHLNGSL